MKRLHAIGFAVVISCALTGCSKTEVIMKKQAEMEARLDQVVTVQTEATTSLKDLSTQVAELRAGLKATLLELEQLKPGYRELKTSLETTSQKLDKLAFEAAARPAPPEQTVKQPEAAAPTEVKADKPASAQAAPPQPSPSGKELQQEKLPLAAPVVPQLLPSDPQALYTKAFKLYAADHFSEAIAVFDAFLTRYPTNAYAPNARYWKGECYYSLKKFPSAYDTFMQVIADYPQSVKAPDAMLKAAFTLSALGTPDKGKELMRQLLEKYPGSDAAVKARERLGIGKPKAKGK